MPHTIKDARKKDVSVNIRTSDNGGVIVECNWHEETKSDDDEGCSPSSYKHKTYVYETMEAALADIPGLVSLKQDMDPSDDIDRRMMKEEKEDY